MKELGQRIWLKSKEASCLLPVADEIHDNSTSLLFFGINACSKPTERTFMDIYQLVQKLILSFTVAMRTAQFSGEYPLMLVNDLPPAYYTYLHKHREMLKL